MTNPLNDLLTIERIKSMHPILRYDLVNDYIEINRMLPKYVRLRITYTYRSDRTLYLILILKEAIGPYTLSYTYRMDFHRGA